MDQIADNVAYPEKSSLCTIRQFIIEVCICLAAVFLLRAYVFVVVNVPTGSMLNTIQLNDRIIGNKLAYRFHEPERGDIIIFNFTQDSNDTLYIKRLIGLPGDTIEIEDAQLIINGRTIKEDYLYDDWLIGNDDMVFTVPEDCYFFLGDNRNDSFDSRFWDYPYVSETDIIAKAELTLFPFQHIKCL